MEVIDVVISFAPYEKELLSGIHSQEKLTGESSQNHDSLIDAFFEGWVSYPHFLYAMRFFGEDF